MRKKAFLCGAVCAVLLTGCASSETAVDEEVTGEKETLKAAVTEAETESEPETLGEISPKLIMSECDYDGDDKDDILFCEEGDDGAYVYVRFATGAQVLLGTYNGDIGSVVENTMLATCDLNGDGRRDLIFETRYDETGVMEWYKKIFVLDEDGEYEELKQDKVTGGEIFVVSRQDTRLAIKCEDAGFTDYYWDEASRIYYNYGIGFGTVTVRLSPVRTDVVTAKDGTLDHFEYFYLLGNRNNGIEIKESYSLEDGGKVTGMEIVTTNNITDYMREAGDASDEYDGRKSDRDKKIERIRDIVREAFEDEYFAVYDDEGRTVIEFANYSKDNDEKYQDISDKIASERLASAVVCRKLTWPEDGVSKMALISGAPSDVLKLDTGEAEPASTISEALIDGKSCYVLDENEKPVVKTIGAYASELPYGISDHIYDSGRLQYVDIDNDGQKECAIIYAFTYTIILKEYDGRVVMYGITSRGAGDFLVNGLASASGGAFSEDYVRIKLLPDGGLTTKAVFYTNDMGLDGGRGYIPAGSEGEYEEVSVEEYMKWRDNYFKENPVAEKYELTETGVKEMLAR